MSKCILCFNKVINLIELTCNHEFCDKCLKKELFSMK